MSGQAPMADFLLLKEAAGRMAIRENYAALTCDVPTTQRGFCLTGSLARSTDDSPSRHDQPA